jgi:thiol-disulfide isomerase/thioredoxin
MVIIFNYNQIPDLTREKFGEIIKSKIKVFNFNTSWCGWSKRLQPEWDKFNEFIKLDPKLAHIEVYDIKCDDDKNNSMCESYKVPGYPYIVIEVNGKRTHYNGERTAKGLINEMSL